MGKYEELPLTNTFITTDLNQKPKIILLKANVLGYEFDLQFITVSYLVKDCEIGLDMIRYMRMEINLNENNIMIRNKECRILELKFEEESYKVVAC